MFTWGSVGGMMKIVNALVAVDPLLSFTCTVKLKAPGSVGVPAMVPLELSDRAVAMEPALTDHVYGWLPPTAASVNVGYA